MPPGFLIHVDGGCERPSSRRQRKVACRAVSLPLSTMKSPTQKYATDLNVHLEQRSHEKSEGGE